MNSGLSCYIKAANPTMETLLPDAKSGLRTLVHISLGSTFMLFWTIKTPCQVSKHGSQPSQGAACISETCSTEWLQGWSGNNLIDYLARVYSEWRKNEWMNPAFHIMDFINTIYNTSDISQDSGQKYVNSYHFKTYLWIVLLLYH